ncbi:hypothetical protein [Ralstonia phage phiRSL1]|uniref:Uncharacterized protein n=1 Tax=Ralstonia phage phiRSL1 TaxID=1980924 RepID=B2ZXP6_9CAUD|nr:hypothetical protein RSL1_ORF026 [Ralstonia phage phiRSL1]BAG41471.1 hypothetical protein [Ralstonia phage phiRSL1]
MCLPFLHKWTKWEVKSRASLQMDILNEQGKRFTHTVPEGIAHQERVCQRCGRLQIRITTAKL